MVCVFGGQRHRYREKRERERDNATRERVRMYVLVLLCVRVWCVCVLFGVGHAYNDGTLESHSYPCLGSSAQEPTGTKTQHSNDKQ